MRIHNWLATFLLNTCTLICGFVPIAQYQTEEYSILNFPMDNGWYGIAMKLVFIIIPIALNRIISQTHMQDANNAKTASFQSLSAAIVLAGIMVVTTKFDITYNIWAYILLVLFMVVAFIEYSAYRYTKNLSIPLTNIFHKTAPQQNADELGLDLESEPKPVKPMKQINAEIKASLRAKTSFSTITYTTLVVTLLHNVPIVADATFFVLPDAQIASKLLLITLILAYSLFIKPEIPVWSVVVNLFSIGVFVYVEFVLFMILGFYGLSIWTLFLIVFMLYAIRNVIFN